MVMPMSMVVIIMMISISDQMAEDYLVRHVVPEALAEVKKEILGSVKEIIIQDKIRTLMTYLQNPNKLCKNSQHMGDSYAP